MERTFTEPFFSIANSPTLLSSALDKPHIPRYRFKSIQEDGARLLILHCGKLDDQIECSLITVNLSSPCTYDALSYWWGDPKESATQRVLIRNDDKTSTREFGLFLVKSNLISALKQFREPDVDMVLWIDAICIDQENINEKNKQVAKMAEIYHKATRVRVWLGAAADDSDVAMDWVQDVVDLSSFDSLATNPGNLRKWSAFAEVMGRVWFTRRWVVQELTLAREARIYCGNKSVSWEDFAGAVALYVASLDSIRKASLGPAFEDSSLSHWCFERGAVEATGASLLVNVTSNLFRKSDKGEIIQRLATLETLIASLVAFEASDPKDIVYAFLSIASHIPQDPRTNIYHAGLLGLQQNSSLVLEADYNQSIIEIYTNFVALCIKSSGSLDIICRHWAPMEHYDLSEFAVSTAIDDFLDLSRNDVPTQIYDLCGISQIQISNEDLPEEEDFGGWQPGENDSPYVPPLSVYIEPLHPSHDETLFPIPHPELQNDDFTHEAPQTAKAPSQLSKMLSRLNLKNKNKQYTTKSKSIKSSPSTWETRLDGTQLNTGFGSNIYSHNISPTGRDSEGNDTVIPNRHEMWLENPAEPLQSESSGPNLHATTQASYVNHSPYHSYVHSGQRLHGGGYVPYRSDPHSHGGDFKVPTDIHEPVPSWIPILSESAFGASTNSHLRSNADSLVGLTHRRPYNAAGGMIAEVRFKRESTYTSFGNWRWNSSMEGLESMEGKESMAVRGFPIGIITALSSAMDGGLIPEDGLNMGGLARLRNPYTTLKIPDRLWRTLVADRDQYGQRPPYWYYIACLHCLTSFGKMPRSALESNFNITEIPDDLKSSDSVSKYLERVQSVVWGRRFFKSTYNDLFGLVPRRGMEGDLVCILYGCSVPVVLRRCVSKKGAFFEIIGEAYVHGMMDGEALQGRDKEYLNKISNWFVLL